MSKQYNKAEKRKRRQKYLKRTKIAAKAKKPKAASAPVESLPRAEPAPA